MLSRKPSTRNRLPQHPPLPPLDYSLGSDSVVVLPKDWNELHRKLINPGSQYRNSRTGNRATRTQIDHDVFEGLPVRHWRKRPISVNAVPEKENIDNAPLRNLTWKELPMPRDSHLLSLMSQDLLRAARMPQAKKPTTTLPEEDKEPGEDEDAGGEIDTGFVARRWTVLPKELEIPDREFLAKRRKGLPSAHSGTLTSTGNTGQMRKTKIRKVDNEGNNSVLEVLVPEGQTLQGEVVEEATSPTQAPAPGTVVEGVGVVNAEGVVIAGEQGLPGINRKRPGAVKRKHKGPGRGRKKKVAFVGPDGAPTADGGDGASYGAIKTHKDQAVDGGQGVRAGGTQMGEASLLKGSEQEGEEGSEEGSEDEDGEEGDREEGELSPSPNVSKSPTMPPPPIIVEPGAERATISPSVPHPLATMPPVAAEPALPITAPTTEPIDVSSYDPAVDIIGEPVDEILEEAMDEMLDEPANDLPPEAADEPMSRNMTGAMTGPMPEPVANTEQESKPEMYIEIRTGDVAEFMEFVEDKSTGPTAEPKMEFATEQTFESVAEPRGNSIPELTINSTMELAVEPIAEPVMEADAGQLSNAASGPAPEAVEGATTEAVGCVPAMAEPITETEVTPVAVTELRDGSIEAERDERIVEYPSSSPVETTADTVEESSAEPTAGQFAQVAPAPQSTHEPDIEQANEPMTEYVQERKYSLTRPTSSPKAPTPSPPTPIGSTFNGLQAPPQGYLSPKAPTMSPPTPIERGMSDPPDLPPLPPHIEAAQEAEPAMVPNIDRIREAERISVEAAPEVEPQVNAHVPVEHDPLDGLAEPKAGKGFSCPKASSEVPAHFSDGEEDLLGSLERSLGSGDGPS